MPQGRRKTPFSGKAKKEQLKAKKQLKSFDFEGDQKKALLVEQQQNDEASSSIRKINFQPVKDNARSNKYVLQFHNESKEELKERREFARQSLLHVTEKELEVVGENYFLKELDFPKRPQWSFNMSRDQLEQKEQKYFKEYISSIEEKFSWKELSFFELNLETWRQLWRVLEMSDIVLFIVDIRFAGLMFPPSLYDYVINVLKKNMILILNKIDLSPVPLVAAWKDYFTEKYPKLHVLMFTTMPGYNLLGKQNDKAGLQIRRRKGRLRMAAEGTQLLLEACKEIVGNNVDLSTWQEKIKEETMLESEEDESTEVGETINVTQDVGYFEHEHYKGGVLTIGCLGQPNVGKSSVMNAIMGKKVVSVSKTPGHTKHFQTIFLTNNVRLCDCPGLIFPSKVPKPLQVLMGSFPIAQLKEPFTTIRYLAERLDLVKLLRIDHPEGDDEWSAMDICDGWAKKRGYLTAKAARLDSYRAANSLLRMALDGKICLSLMPPNYVTRKDYWQNHPSTDVIKWILARRTEESDNTAGSDISDEDVEPKPAAGSGDTEHKKLQTESESDNDQIDLAGANKFAVLNTED
ncbi:50S ribosome-binding GTPase [Popillia japonica]|uniref:Guanine nucleotide-binding protein-like 1 n=1 Tax=Popillia japonica TaxID=7064 RepID=A0AAW1JGY6_POPJA